MILQTIMFTCASVGKDSCIKYVFMVLWLSNDKFRRYEFMYPSYIYIYIYI